MANWWQKFLSLCSSFSQNLGFVLTCFAIIAGLYIAAKVAEHFLPEPRTISKTRRLTIVAICAALSAVLMLLEFPLVFLAPDFYKLDFSELPALIASFALGPVSGVIVCFIKNAINAKYTAYLFIAMRIFFVFSPIILPPPYNPAREQ